MRDIHTIMGGLGHSRILNTSHKQHIQAIRQGACAEVYTSYQLQLDALVAQAITFTDEEATKVIQQHDDAFMLTLQIVNHNVHRVLIDIRSLVDIPFYLAFNQMELPPIVLKLTNTPLYMFAGCNVQPFKEVDFLITTCNHLAQATIFTNFLVVDAPSIL